MAFDALGPLNRLIAILQGNSHLQQVYKGVPDSLSNQVDAYILMGGQQIGPKYTSVLQRKLDYFIGFCYAVADAPDTAEDTIALAVDEFIAAIAADLTLNNTVKSAEMDFSVASQPEYQLMAGQEFRVYPVIIRATQQGTFNASP